MFTEFFRPYDLTTRSITEATFVLEKKLTEQLSLFTEYVGDYPQGASPSQLWNSGAVYHINRLQQVDFHIAFGLNHNAPELHRRRRLFLPDRRPVQATVAREAVGRCHGRSRPRREHPKIRRRNCRRPLFAGKILWEIRPR